MSWQARAFQNIFPFVKLPPRDDVIEEFNEWNNRMKKVRISIEWNHGVKKNLF